MELMIEERRVGTCLPILAEILSGISSTEKNQIVSDAFNGMIFTDADWNAMETWNKVAQFAHESHRKHLGISGIADRMILLSAKESGAILWTLDKKLKRLAEEIGIKTQSSR